MMKELKKAFKFIYYNLIKKESDLKSAARFTEEEVAETARRYAAGLGWVSDFTQNLPHLSYEEEKLIWNVFFLPTQGGLIVRGGCLRIYVDDETGEVIRKLAGTR